MTISCESRIDRVVVHARGALVVRQVSLPAALPDGDVDLIVPGVTLLALPGSLRAAVASAGRQIVFAGLGLHVPAFAAVAAPDLEAVGRLARRLERLRAEQAALERRRATLDAVQPQAPLPRTLLTAAQLAARVRDSVAVSELAREEQARTDARLLSLGPEVAQVDLELRAAQLQLSQASSQGLLLQGQVSRQAVVRLVGEGPATSLELSYAVPAARWWPASTLRLEGGGARALWELEALVAQATGEDWRGARISVSTADLLLDARLPEQRSLRFGRAQPAPRSGYRPPPNDTAALFAAFDRAFPHGLPSRAPVPQQPTPVLVATASIAAALSQEESFGALGGTALDDSMDEVAPKASAPPPPPSGRVGGGRPSAPSRAMQRPPATMMMAAAPMARGAPPPPPAPTELEPTELEPASGWLDFDALSLPGAEDRGRRGRLARQDDAQASSRAQAGARLEATSPGVRFLDPLGTRGQFDHRYDAQAAADVPSDGAPHRLRLASAEGRPALRLRTVPREAAEVYREVQLDNPFSGPLLEGPVDVYVEGTLLTTTSHQRIDRGGSFAVGLGVEERVRVARNVSVEESSAGLLGGRAEVLHAVRIELQSSLGRPVEVEVIDLAPVTDDKEVKVERLRAEPPAEEFTQAARGQPVRGGLLWKLQLPAGGKVAVEHRYRIVLSSKDELVGGNRRE